MIFNNNHIIFNILFGTPQWARGSPQWALGTPQWAVGTPQRTLGNPQWAVASEHGDGGYGPLRGAVHGFRAPRGQRLEGPPHTGGRLWVRSGGNGGGGGRRAGQESHK